MEPNSKSSEQQDDPEDWEKVPFDVVRARVFQVEGLAELQTETVEALAAAICLCCRHPPELGKLITRAKETITSLYEWLASYDEFPEFQQYSKEICDRLENLRRNVVTVIKYDLRGPRLYARVSFDSEGVRHFLVDEEREETEPPVPEQVALVAPNTPFGDSKLLDEFLVLAMGVLREAAVEANPEEALRIASAQAAILLDTFWAADGRFRGDIVRAPRNVKKQYRRALKSASVRLTTSARDKLIDMHRRGDPAVKHAWLPVRRKAPD
jgi:hypothetical protein